MIVLALRQRVRDPARAAEQDLVVAVRRRRDARAGDGSARVSKHRRHTGPAGSAIDITHARRELSTSSDRGRRQTSLRERNPPQRARLPSAGALTGLAEVDCAQIPDRGPRYAAQARSRAETRA